LGLFSKMKAAAGIGASSVQVVLENKRYHWGETVRGKVDLQGGEVEQNASAVLVNLTETWEDVDSDGDRQTRSRSHGEQMLAQQVSIPIGSHQEWPFTLAIPPGASLTSDWSVVARVKVSGAVDRQGKADFALLAPRAVRALSQALCKLAECELKALTNNGERITAELQPLPQRRKDLDGLKLMVSDNGQQVIGTFEINPQEKSFADRLKALAKKDLVHHAISFDSVALAAADENESALPPEVVEQLKGFLAPHLS
jgi:sporulation-control protein spo0M